MPAVSTPIDHPRVGMLATVRNRLAVITSVDVYPTATGNLHLVHVEYTDSDGVPSDSLIWEREHCRRLQEPHQMPDVFTRPAMPHDHFDALVRSARWSAITPFVKPDGTLAELPVASPFFGAVQVDDFQLVPLLQALQMPRVSLLLADDVGLGKTVEAGLILSELLIRRRIRRILILTPAALRLQWQQEMIDKFSLTFDVVDRAETHALQKRLGLDANPWRTFPRVITSYHYLRQPDVLEQFLATCRSEEGHQAAQLPWDLLVVDEAHNLMPAGFGPNSDLSEMLRAISPWFEHKLFLTATPHNGHTRCFSGLLELLDPVRFAQTRQFTDAEKRRVTEVVVRRLKREINELDKSAKRPQRFANRHLEPVPLYFGREEKKLAKAFSSFRTTLRGMLASRKRGEVHAGYFAVEVFQKRLLSCPMTFADSWFRFKQGLAEDEAVDTQEVSAAQRSSAEDIDDDKDRLARDRHAARTIGGWLRPYLPALTGHVAEIDACIAALGVQVEEAKTPSLPKTDERYARLKELVERRLRQDDAWVADERLIVFTEYKTTLDYLERRLKADFKDTPGAIRVLWGGMPDREAIKKAFNDPADPVRILVATDAASEGLNLQETARLLLHFEIPWNPSRLEQRNGRLDRHGQARDVTIYHFTSEDDADLRFVAHVVKKVNEIREDLGSMGQVFDAAFQRRFQDEDDVDRVVSGLDRQVASRPREDVPREPTRTTGIEEITRLDALKAEIDLSPETLCQTLGVAMGLGQKEPAIQGPDARGHMQLRTPLPPAWEALIDDTIRLPRKESGKGALPDLIFDPRLFIILAGSRPVFRPAKDTRLLHLGHPLFRQALATFTRARFDTSDAASRWTVRHSVVPGGNDALLLLSVEELAVNELREPFHHLIRTWRIPIRSGELGAPLPFLDPAHDQAPAGTPDERALDAARAIWAEVHPEVVSLVRARSKALTATIQGRLGEARKASLDEHKDLFKKRLAEVEKAIKETTMAALEEEKQELLSKLAQSYLFETISRDIENQLRNLEEEMLRRRSHYQDLLDQLKVEQVRVLERLLPKRFTLHGEAYVFPVAVEIRLPGGAA